MFYTFDNVIKLSQAFLTHFSYHKLTNTVEPGWLPPACQKECFQVDNLNENVMKVWIKPSTPDSQYYNYEVQSPFPVIKGLRETFWRPAVNALIATWHCNEWTMCYNLQWTICYVHRLQTVYRSSLQWSVITFYLFYWFVPVSLLCL